jgi:MFS family permease
MRDRQPKLSARHNLWTGDIGILEDHLDEFNASRTGFHDSALLCLELMLGDELVGAIAGFTWAGFCELRQFWIDERFRRAGHGSALLNGAIWTTQLALLPVYGVRAGLPEGPALLLLSAFILGMTVLQVPIGRLLDKWSGRSMLFLCGAAQCLGAIALPFVVHDSVLVWLSLLIWGGFLAGLYTTEMTMIGRSFATKELPGASTAFTMAFNFGAHSGPAVAGVAMQIWDPHGMLVVIGAAGAGVAIMSISLADAKQPVDPSSTVPFPK